MKEDKEQYAFPHEVFEYHESLEGTHKINTGHSEGMTLRDYFAAKAMQGIISNTIANPRSTAIDAYAYADAMLKSRELTKLKED